MDRAFLGYPTWSDQDSSGGESLEFAGFFFFPARGLKWELVTRPAGCWSQIPLSSKCEDGLLLQRRPPRIVGLWLQSGAFLLQAYTPGSPLMMVVEHFIFILVKTKLILLPASRFFRSMRFIAMFSSTDKSPAVSCFPFTGIFPSLNWLYSGIRYSYSVSARPIGPHYRACLEKMLQWCCKRMLVLSDWRGLLTWLFHCSDLTNPAETGRKLSPCWFRVIANVGRSLSTSPVFMDQVGFPHWSNKHSKNVMQKLQH